MDLLKFHFILNLAAIILCLKGLAEGKSFPHNEEIIPAENKVKHFLHRAIIEFGYRVGALELPEERGGLRVTGPSNNIAKREESEEIRASLLSTVNRVGILGTQDGREVVSTLSSNNNENNIANAGNRYVYNLYWHRKKCMTMDDVYTI